SVQLVEAGVNVPSGTAKAGVSAATIQLTKGDVDSGDHATFDTTGWTDSGDHISFTKAGTYGVATLNVSTGALSYALHNEFAATNMLADGAAAHDDFVINVADDSAVVTTQTAVFNITGSDDAATL